MIKNKISATIVIPVYNDAEQLLGCLRAIERLRPRADEVIVVDNNSTDETRAAAELFPFVRVITECKRGVVHARTTGFNVAQSDIICRIDADTLLPSDWLGKVQELFRRNQNLSAVSGSMYYYDFHLTRLSHKIDLVTRRFMARFLSDRVFLQGANMALRRSAWLAVNKQLCACSGTHEDQDLAIHLQENGYKVAYESKLVAGISGRRIGSGFLDFARYCLINPRTYAEHKIIKRVYMYPVILAFFIIYLPAHLIYLSYDEEFERYSLRSYLTNRLNEPRVDPSINAA